MRFTPTRPSCPDGRVRRPGALALTLTLTLALAAQAHGQATKAKPATPPPPDTRPLARYVPRENLVIYAGCDGLDAHADAWKKTAAYKMLNDTPLGEMLEAMVTQLAEKAMAMSPNRKVTAAEAVAMFKHVARSGFVFSVNAVEKGKGPSDDLGTVVLRGAAGRTVRQPFSRLLGGFMGKAKPQVVKKGTRNAVVVPMNDPKKKDETWAWWAEGDDLVICMGKETEDVVMAVLDGKRPSAVNHPVRAEVAGAEGGFLPIGVLFVDPAGSPKNSASSAFFAKMADMGVKRADYRWGFQDDALMTVLRMKAPKPRKGPLAVFDQPTFEKGKLPPLPEGIEAFTAISVDPARVFDAVLAMAPTPEARAKVTEQLDALKTRSRIDLRKDLLAHLGPKMVLYVVPGTAPARPAGEADAAGAGAAANPLAGMLSGLPGLGAGGAVPRLTVVAQIDDAAAVGKTIDNLMVVVNRQLKEQASAAAEAATPPPAGGPGQPAPPRARTARRSNAPAPEFKLMPGTDKVYTLSVPAGSAVSLPRGFRPTVRLGSKLLAISVTPDAARQALETKPGAWTPPSDLSAAFEQLPKSLVVLNVSDPRSTLPDVLASLPAALQRGVNTAVAMSQAKATGGPGAAGAPGGVPGSGSAGYGSGSSGYGGPPGGSGGMSQSQMLAMQARAARGESMSMPSSSSGSGGGAPPAAGGEAGGAASMLQFRIDPAKLPKADDLRAKLFPASFAVSSDDQEVRVVSRQAFPSVASPASAAVAAALLMPAVQSARAAARRAAGLPPAAGPLPALPAAAGAAAASPPAPTGGGALPPKPGMRRPAASSGGPGAGTAPER